MLLERLRDTPKVKFRSVITCEITDSLKKGTGELQTCLFYRGPCGTLIIIAVLVPKRRAQLFDFEQAYTPVPVLVHIVLM